MKRTLIIEVIFDPKEWEDYEDVSDELLLEDSGIFDILKNGVDVKLIKQEQK